MTRSAFIAAVEEILGLPKRSLREQDDRTTILQWTSLADVQIFALVTDTFGIDADEELIQAESVRDLLRILESRGAFESSLAC
jgi:acyl carrier protein